MTLPLHNNFWQQITGPLMILAPMEDVTDTAFRELVMRMAQPGQLHVLYTEFTSTDGLCHPVGRERVEERLRVSQSERELLQQSGIKLVAQIWGNKPEKFAQATQYISENYDFDAIDINMGCPVRNVVAHGSCSALIDNEPLAAEIIAATRRATHLPLSVKTRLGVRKIDTQRWMRFLLQQPIDAIILHGRIQKQMSEGEARWDEIAIATEMRNELAPHIKMIGNGDVESLEDAHQRCQTFGTDGVMIGRGIFKNPWLFDPQKGVITPQDRLQTLLMHLDLFEQSRGNTKPFLLLRRFFKIYLTGFAGAANLRALMMETHNCREARHIIYDFLHNLPDPQPGQCLHENYP